MAVTMVMIGRMIIIVGMINRPLIVMPVKIQGHASSRWALPDKDRRMPQPGLPLASSAYGGWQAGLNVVNLYPLDTNLHCAASKEDAEDSPARPEPRSS
jgi:hypothetical protein